ncbi:MAG: colanic acid biosynthesis glycosyltransferase WcaL [Rhodospirillaceae bacterium]|nr:colanic acid biosynthesis glycosyltransferase WcaL [Rhodospirillaceae bacterium]|tara:strand:- start:4680 stop:5966 length:1287 start_codon:yes stop_codon:yes gene_type:complete
MQANENELKTLINPLAVVLKGYPRLSETFIAQEIFSLERAGSPITIVSLRKPTETQKHPVHHKIKAHVLYLPEYLYKEPLRVIKGWLKARTQPGYRTAKEIWVKDLLRDFSANRIRRWGQSLVLVAELDPKIQHLYAHFLHTPASVAYYAALVSRRTWSVSAHAKDIWLTPDWEKREKLVSCTWAVTCTKYGLEHLATLAPGKTRLSYHGLDLSLLPRAPTHRNKECGTSDDKPISFLSVGRAVPKKGFDVLLHALEHLPPNIYWRWVHIGTGKELKKLKKLALSLNLSDKIIWRGPCNQDDVFYEYSKADLFIMPSIVAADGDRDGLPNVVMEAASQKLCCIASDVAGLKEFIQHNETGWLVPPGDIAALRNAILKLTLDCNLRTALGSKSFFLLNEKFSHFQSIKIIMQLLEQHNCTETASIRDSI